MHSDSGPITYEAVHPEGKRDGGERNGASRHDPQRTQTNEETIHFTLCTDQIGRVQHVFIIMGCLCFLKTNTQLKWTNSKVQLILIFEFFSSYYKVSSLR